ncbi:MAG: protein kinase [Bifidobacteriaceae bacterium]|jgi:hypothetical protein|nr:protein kinase [Bifidobacteriaceae bacterium]
MSPARQASAPPLIEGFEPISLLGQGGFADVFLYQQRTPRRRVALKVLLPEVIGEGAIERLNDEADAMAELSAHPHIVTVYGSGVSDDGRPFLAMEYCPKPSLNINFRSTHRSVAEVLIVGVQIAGAVETAHRAGIYHRDIKPANILVTQYDNPALTDFGIAVNLAQTERGIEGLSVPWSPPEAFAATPWAGPQSDVWGLAATIYSLLAKRAPFEIPGSNNKPHAQMDRIQRAPLPPIGRPDVPTSLDQVLATAMAKDPAARYPTALAFGRALQEVQSELRFQPTRLVIEDQGVVEAQEAGDDDAPATRLRSPLRIDPAGPGGSDAGAWPTGQSGTGWQTGAAGQTGADWATGAAAQTGTGWSHDAAGSGWSADSAGSGWSADAAGSGWSHDAAGPGWSADAAGSAGPGWATGASGQTGAGWSADGAGAGWPADPASQTGAAGRSGSGWPPGAGAITYPGQPSHYPAQADGTQGQQHQAQSPYQGAYPATPAPVEWTGRADEALAPVERTILRESIAPAPVAPQAPAAQPTRPGQRPAAAPGQRPPAARSAGAPPGAAQTQLADRPEAGARHRRLGLIVAGSVGLVLAVLAAWLVFGQPDEPTPGAGAESGPAVPQQAGLAEAPDPAGLTGRVDGDQARFTWTNPDPAEGDSYAWALLDALGEPGKVFATDQAEVAVPVAKDGRTCIEVSIVRQDGKKSAKAARACAE